MCCDINREGSSIPTIFQAVELCKELNLTIFLEVKAFVGFGPPKVRKVIGMEIQSTCCLQCCMENVVLKLSLFPPLFDSLFPITDRMIF